jgi:hypothetical protein
MNAQIQVLKADIAADLRAIADTYTSLNAYPDTLINQEQVIAVDDSPDSPRPLRSCDNRQSAIENRKGGAR